MTATVPARTRALPLPPGPRLPILVQTLVFSAFKPKLGPLLRRRYGDVFRLRLYPERDLVMLADLDHIKQVFIGSPKLFHAGEGNVVLKPLMGEHSVLLTDEDQHMRARKLLMPAFNGAALRGYTDLVTELTVAELDRWPSGRPFLSHERMQALTLEVILRVVFGVADGPRLEELRRLLGSLLEVSILDLLGSASPALRRVGRWRRSIERLARIDELLYAEIAERRRAEDLDQRSDVLTRLLTVPGDGDRLSDAELRDQLITLLLAGHETTATTLAWVLYELARDPELHDRAAAAADSGDDKYLEALTKEALRLHPVITEVARKVTEDVEIGGFHIPAGTTVMPSISLVQLDSALYPEAQRFRPERFLEGTPPAGSWFPFGGGVRRCLGAGFSLMEANAVLREVLLRFRVSTDRTEPEHAKSRHITMVPSHGSRILVTERETV